MVAAAGIALPRAGAEKQVGPNRSLDERSQGRLFPSQLGIVRQLVGQSRGVREQVENLHGFLALAGKFGNIALHAITEIQLPAFDEEHRRHVDHGLGDGGHVEHRIAADRLGVGLRPLPAEEARRQSTSRRGRP